MAAAGRLLDIKEGVHYRNALIVIGLAALADAIKIRRAEFPNEGVDLGSGLCVDSVTLSTAAGERTFRYLFLHGGATRLWLFTVREGQFSEEETAYFIGLAKRFRH